MEPLWPAKSRKRRKPKAKGNPKEAIVLIPLTYNDETKIPELEAMVARWCGRLGQETMLLKTTDYAIKFVPPQTEAE